MYNLLVCQEGRTRSIGTDCPDWILQEHQPLHLFTNWRQQFAFVFDVRFTRAFPIVAELFQNVPSIVVIDHMPAGQCPLIVHVASSTQPIFCVYEAVEVERIASVLYWLNRHVMLLNRVSLTFNGRRVRGGDDVPVRSGDVLRIRVIPRIEELISTTEPTLSLDQTSHTTWLSLPHSIVRTSDTGAEAEPEENRQTTEYVEQTDGEEEPDEHTLLQSTLLLITPSNVIARTTQSQIVASHFTDQVNSLSWWPERNDDWIDLVVRRRMANAQWGWAKQVHILRPEEPIHPVQRDIRARWDEPSQFGLATMPWTAWPDLNYIRFRLFELSNTYCVESQRGTLTLLVRPSRWGLKAQVIAVEVVRLQWSSIISRVTAHLMIRHFTPKELVQHCKIRDCSVFPCEVRTEGDTIAPDAVVWPRNGDLVTVLVSDGFSGPRRFMTRNIVFEAGWDPRRWRSQEQVITNDGSVMIFRVTTRSELKNTRVRIPTERWHTWEIILRRAEQHWIEHDFDDIQLFRANQFWRQCEEFRNQVDVGILGPARRRRDQRIVIFVCRDAIASDLDMWAQSVEPALNEYDVIDQCERVVQCQQPQVICHVHWNGRPLRFIENILVNNGDIFTLEVQPRITFCSKEPDQWQRGVLHQSNSDPDNLVLLQQHVLRSKNTNARLQAFARPPTTGLPPPGNPTSKQMETGGQTNEGPARPIPTPCRAFKGGVPIRISDYISSGASSPDQIPVCTATALAGLLDFDPVEEALMSDWGSLNELGQDIQAWITNAPKIEYLYWDPFDAHTVHVYTDGSASGNRAGWAFVIQAETPHEKILVGYQHGSFAHLQWHNRMGPPTEYNAEVQALTAATWWMLRFMRALGWKGHLHFHWDSTVAGGKAVGAYTGAATQEGNLCEVCNLRWRAV